jgi:hypothetical protein
MRTGRKRKIGHRYPSGDLKRPNEHNHPELAAIYVIELTGGLVKIGVSINPARRENQMFGSTEDAKLICCFWLNEKRARDLEKTIHKQFRQKSFHAKDEIYYLDAETAIAMIKPILKEAKITGIEQFDLTPQPFNSEYISSTGMAANGGAVRRGRRRRNSPAP